MCEQLRFLYVEDNIDDSDLLELDLRREGFNFFLQRVETESTFRNALVREHWDLVISDVNLPSFSAQRTLDIISELDLIVPVIIVSGAVGEETAVELLRNGARDFILKGSKARLIPAIKRELAEAKLRSEKIQAKFALKKTEEMLQLAQEVAQVGSWAWSVNDDFITWSESMSVLTGYNKGDFQNTIDGLLSIVLPEDQTTYRTCLLESVKNKSYFNIEYRIRLKNGETRWFESRGRTIVSKGGITVLGICIDISVHIHRQNELRLAKEKAEENDQLKSAFLANISHELRTPLNAIIGFSEILLDDELEYEEVNQFSTTINKNGQHLLSLINDIVDIAHLDAGQMKMYRCEFDLHSLLIDIRDCFQTDQKVSKLDEFSIVTPAEDIFVPLMIENDPTRLKQVMLNLVKNALKFTNSGYVKFGYQYHESGQIELFVEDSGIGIPLDKQAIIFERFRQAEQGLTREHEGVGLGLAISQGLVDLMGGELIVSSEVNRGSVFSFILPGLKNSKVSRHFV